MEAAQINPIAQNQIPVQQDRPVVTTPKLGVLNPPAIPDDAVRKAVIRDHYMPSTTPGAVGISNDPQMNANMPQPAAININNEAIQRGMQVGGEYAVNAANHTKRFLVLAGLAMAGGVAVAKRRAIPVIKNLFEKTEEEIAKSTITTVDELAKYAQDITGKLLSRDDVYPVRIAFHNLDDPTKASVLGLVKYIAGVVSTSKEVPQIKLYMSEGTSSERNMLVKLFKKLAPEKFVNHLAQTPALLNGVEVLEFGTVKASAALKETNNMVVDALARTVRDKSSTSDMISVAWNDLKRTVANIFINE